MLWPCVFPVGIPRPRYPKVSGGSLHKIPSLFCTCRSLPDASLLQLNGPCPGAGSLPGGVEGSCLCGYAGHRSSPLRERSRIVVFWEQGDNLNLYSLGFFLFFPAESLVHLQRNHDSGERDAGRVQPGAAVWGGGRRPRGDGAELGVLWGGALGSPLTLPLALPNLSAPFCCSLARSVSRCFLEELMRRDPSCKFGSLNPGQLWEETKPLLKLPRTL